MVNGAPRCPISPEPDIMLPLGSPSPMVAVMAGGIPRGTGVVMQTALDGR